MMLAIPKEELIKIIENSKSDVVFLIDLHSLFNYYGDEYYADHSSSQFVLTKINKNRIKFMKKIKKE